MSQPDFTVEHLDPKTLLPNPLNWRRHPDSQREALAYSLERFNFVQGVIWNETTARLVDGHARVEEAIRQGRKTVPVNVVRLSEEDERALLRVFDPIGAMALTDDETLDRLIAEIGDPDLERLLGELETGSGGLLEDADPDHVPDNAPTRCKPGDLWRLGEHRLLCGDSTVSTDVERLMDGEAVTLLFDDPPYGIDWQWSGGGMESYRGTTVAHSKKWTGDRIKGDETPDAEYLDLWLPLLIGAGAVYLCSLWSVEPYWRDALEERGWTIKNRIIWVKNYQGAGDLAGAYGPQHETIFFAHQGGHKLREKRIGDVWTTPDTTGCIRHGKEHPTQKPAELVTTALTHSSDTGAIIADPHAGSGTTLIACEQTGRVARCMEIEPRYCDVIIARYEQATGKAAELA